MELRVLRYFVAVAEHGSVAAASRHLHTSQPSLSRQIRGLEVELGSQLFIRGGGPLRLTPAGEALAAGARDLLRRADDVRRIAPTQRDLSEISIACPQQLFENHIAPALIANRLALPRIYFRESVSIAEEVIQGRADIGINPVPPPSSLESIVYTRGSLTLQLPVDSDPFPPGPVELRDVPDGVTALEQGRETRRVLDRACEAAGVRLRIGSEVETARVAQLLAAVGHAPCIVSDDLEHFGLARHALARDGEPVTIVTYAMWRHGHYLRERFLELLELLGPPSDIGAKPEPEPAPEGRSSPATP